MAEEEKINHMFAIMERLEAIGIREQSETENAVKQELDIKLKKTYEDIVRRATTIVLETKPKWQFKSTSSEVDYYRELFTLKNEKINEQNNELLKLEEILMRHISLREMDFKEIITSTINEEWRIYRNEMMKEICKHLDAKAEKFSDACIISLGSTILSFTEKKTEMIELLQELGSKRVREASRIDVESCLDEIILKMLELERSFKIAMTRPENKNSENDNTQVTKEADLPR